MHNSNFYFLPDYHPEYPSETELHKMIKWWRHGRATRSIWETIQEAYVLIFTVLLLGAMVISVIQSSNTAAQSCQLASCTASRILLPPTLVLTLAVMTLNVSRVFGPILASAAEGFWLFGTPVTRTKLLQKRLWLAQALALLFPGLITLVITLLTGAKLFSAIIWALTAAILNMALLSLAAYQQTQERTRILTITKVIFGLLAALSAFGLVSLAAGWWQLPVSESQAQKIASAIGGFALLSQLLLHTLATKGLPQLKRTRLISGGEIVSGMQGAMYGLDFGLMRDILVDREAYRRGSVKSTKGYGVGAKALIWRDFQRIRRFPKPLLGLIGAALVPYALVAMGIIQMLPFIAGLTLVMAMVPFLQMMRVISRTDGLRRLFPYRNTTLRQVAMVMPGFFALIWVLVTLPAFFLGVENASSDSTKVYSIAFLTGFAGLMGGVRWVSAAKVNFNTPMIATESGAVPPMLILNLFRGIDMVAVITAPLILGMNPLWATGIAIVVFLGMSGTFNMAEMQAQKEQADRELAEARKAKTKAKKKIPR